PTPILNDGDECFLAQHQAGPEQKTDRDGGKHDEGDHRSAALIPQHRPQRAHDEKYPKQETDKEIELPEATDVCVFVALMAEPEIGRKICDKAIHRRPLSRERANDDDKQAHEQEVDAKSLEARLVA